MSSGEVAVAQDSFNIAADKGPSSYDRPHRFTGNVVWELPFYRDQAGVLGKILGGWQLSTNFTPAERVALHRAERRRSDRRADRHRRPGGQRHPAQHQHHRGPLER